MYEELRKAYDTTADRLWLVNCGDPERLGDAGFALPRHGLGHRPLHGRQRRDLPGTLAGRHLRRSVLRPPRGDDPRTPAAGLPRKPEYMGWGYHWNRFDHNCEQLTDTDFSFTNYDEAQRRLEAYRAARRPGRSPVARDRRRSPPGFLPAGLLPPARRRTDEPHDARRASATAGTHARAARRPMPCATRCSAATTACRSSPGGTTRCSAANGTT